MRTSGPAERETSLSASYLAPPAGMQEALQRIGRALEMPDWSVADAPQPSLVSVGSGSGLGSGSEVADSRIELRLESDSEGEQESQEPFDGFTSLQTRPERANGAVPAQ